jgi:hypothetical protein
MAALDSGISSARSTATVPWSASSTAAVPWNNSDIEEKSSAAVDPDWIRQQLPPLGDKCNDVSASDWNRSLPPDSGVEVTAPPAATSWRPEETVARTEASWGADAVIL